MKERAYHGRSYTGYTWSLGFDGPGKGWWCTAIDGRDTTTIWTDTTETHLYRVQAINTDGSDLTDGTITQRSYWQGMNVEQWLMTRGHIEGTDYATPPTGSLIVKSVDYSDTKYWLNSTYKETVYGKSATTYGFRPIVELKAGVMTGQSKDKNYLNQNCWSIYAP